LGREQEVNVMRHHNSVFHGLLQHVPWAVFERLVEKHGADHRVRRLSSKSQFIALLFGQLAGAASLREIEAGLESHAGRLYHLDASCVARSSLADANARRPFALYADLFAHMAAGAGRSTRRHLKDAMRILDATRIELGPRSAGWLDSVKGHRAIKLHIAYDPGKGLPLRASTSHQRVNDITPAKAMPIEPAATYVFDLAYYDFAWWARLHEQGCRFVTRLKSHTRLSHGTERAVAGGQDTVLADRTGLLPRRTRAGRDPFPHPVREITVTIATGKTIRLITNDLDAPAADIAELYKQRWQIELFFKWIKQNLKICHFIGTSENAVRIQIFVALIAYLLVRAAHAAQSAVTTPITFIRLVRLNIMHRRPINALKTRPPKPDNNNPQLTLNL
jgi:hypothetical protein